MLDSRKVSVERLRPSISALVYAGTLCRMDDSMNGWRFQQSWSETIELSASGGHGSQRLWFGVPTTRFGPDAATFTSTYFSLVVFNSLLAIAISVYVCQPMSILTSKKPAKWSLPGTALFGGLVS